jgi:hypothetical protein
MRRVMWLVVLLALAISGHAYAQGERLSDRGVTDLMESIDKGRDRFVDALDSQFKHSVMRSPTSEVDVSKYLDDFDKNIHTMKDRFKPEYAASAEVQRVLRQASEIDAYVRMQGTMKGASEWNALAGQLNTLAGAYGTSFPIGESTPVRRLGDKEVADAAEMVARQSSPLKDAIEKDTKGWPEADRHEAKRVAKDAELLEKDAKLVKSRVADSKPASAEYRTLAERAGRIDAYVVNHALPTASVTMDTIRAAIAKLNQAFRL